MESSFGVLSLNDEEDTTLQELLWQLSTQKFQATFLNDKEIEVQYNYDRERPHKDRVEINLQYLLPVLGGIMPSDGMKFVSALGVEDFLKKTLDLHKCSDGMYTPCSDSDVNLDQHGPKCNSDHFHHYCPEHVNAWFKYYLTTVILLREGDYEEAMKLARPQDVDYLTTGDRPTPEYWLRYAQRKGCIFSQKPPQELLRQLSTIKFQATFLTGKEIEVEYTYNTRLPRGRVKINLQCLSPVFGGLMPPGGIKFVSTFDVEDFVKTKLDLHECMDGIYSPCSNHDGHTEKKGNKCPYDHFHHYCPEHVNAWLKNYLTTVILLREGDYADLVKLARPQDADYLTTGDRPTPEYWLQYVQQKGCRISRKTSQELLEQPSTYKFQATFLNGKKIEVEYTYDRKNKLHRGRVKINLQCLLPIFGGLMPSDGMKFVSTYDVKDFLKTRLDLHECMDGIFSPCSNLDGDSEKKWDECPYNHFHHYCPEHVDAWFRFYLTTAIILREGDYADLVKLAKPQQAVEMTTGDRPTPEYWLRYAQRKGCGFPPK